MADSQSPYPAFSFELPIGNYLFAVSADSSYAYPVVGPLNNGARSESSAAKEVGRLLRCLFGSQQFGPGFGAETEPAEPALAGRVSEFECGDGEVRLPGEARSRLRTRRKPSPPGGPPRMPRWAAESDRQVGSQPPLGEIPGTPSRFGPETRCANGR